MITLGGFMELAITNNFEQVTSRQLQTKFGQISDLVKGKTPITITQYGRPTMVLFPYEKAMELVRMEARQNLLNWLEEREKNPPESVINLSIEEINQMIDDERNKL